MSRRKLKDYGENEAFIVKENSSHFSSCEVGSSGEQRVHVRNEAFG